MAKEQTREKVIEALLTCKTVTAAAEMANVSRRTMYNYLRNDADFANVFQQRQQAQSIERLEALTAVHADAVAEIMSIMRNSDSDAVRLKAAGLLLDEYAKAKGAVDAAADKNMHDLDTMQLFGTTCAL